MASSRNTRHKLSSEHVTQAHAAQERLVPVKSLGQNFLVDGNIARKIVAAVGVEGCDELVEIGPGEGALTSLLLASQHDVTNKPHQQYKPRVHLVEYDERAVRLLEGRFQREIAEQRLWIHHADVLKTSLETLADVRNSNMESIRSINVVGNIPYYITSDILFWLFDAYARLQISNSSVRLRKAVIMMQKEVAERVVAKPRTKEYGIVSVAAAFVSVPKILFHVPPTCFYPKPKVTSSVVEFRFYDDSEQMLLGLTAAEAYIRAQTLVRLAFNQRRKMLSNALSSLLRRSSVMSITEILSRALDENISYFRKRAEELTPQDFVRLYQWLNGLENT
jgi:16S rRNA (adenine1518-N6/adenine1519-N6)-dimethyltransferase